MQDWLQMGLVRILDQISLLFTWEHSGTGLDRIQVDSVRFRMVLVLPCVTIALFNLCNFVMAFVWTGQSKFNNCEMTSWQVPWSFYDDTCQLCFHFLLYFDWLVEEKANKRLSKNCQNYIKRSSAMLFMQHCKKENMVVMFVGLAWRKGQINKCWSYTILWFYCLRFPNASWLIRSYVLIRLICQKPCLLPWFRVPKFVSSQSEAWSTPVLPWYPTISSLWSDMPWYQGHIQVR